jgi:hypothetical protein
MPLLITKRRGLGVALPNWATAFGGNGLLNGGSVHPIVRAANGGWFSGTAAASGPTNPPASPTVGQTSQDASGNVYTWNGTSWVLTTSTSGVPTTAAATSSGSGTLASPTIGQTWTDSMGNVYTYGSAGWQLTSAASSGTVPAAAASSTVAATGFPANPVVGQTWTDSSGNVWTYSSTGWAITTPAGSSGTSWFTESTIISGLPNYVIAAGGVLALILVMKSGGGKR